MAIKFSIAKRGLLPTEKTQQGATGETDLRNLRAVLECSETVDAVEFQSGSARLPSLMPKGELVAALNVLQNVLVHEFEKGNAVLLPGIGTFRPSLKGEIEVRNGNYHGRDIHVDGLQFRPDNALMERVRSIEVDQVPCGKTFDNEEEALAARLAELFSRQSTITHKDVAIAFGQTLTRGRIAALLRRLVEEGRLVREGKGAQTRYRASQAL